MKIGILGAGAIGCFLGGRLIAAGHDVVLVGRLGEEIEASGLTLTDHGGGRVRLEPLQIRYFAEPTVLARMEVILVTVKSPATQGAARPLTSILARPIPIVSFQNGVSNPARLRSVLSGFPVLPGMVPFNVARTGPGEFHNGTSGPLAIERSASLEEPIGAALRSAGFDVELEPSLSAKQWSKLLINLNNAVNALAGIPLHEQLRDRTYRRVMAMAVREGLLAMEANGQEVARVGRMIPQLAPTILSLPDPVFLLAARAMVKVDRTARSSMMDDLERGRVTEIDYLNGEILRIVDQHGVPTPVNRKLVELVKQAERARAGSPRIPSDKLLRLVTT